jgi:hypothetical protein
MGAKKFSMLVQDPLPIDTTVAKCLSLLINNNFQNQLPYCGVWLLYFIRYFIRYKKIILGKKF